MSGWKVFQKIILVIGGKAAVEVVSPTEREAKDSRGAEAIEQHKFWREVEYGAHVREQATIVIRMVGHVEAGHMQEFVSLTD